MKKVLQKYADSIDSMGLRERIMFFAAVTLVMVTLLQVFLLNPVLARRNLLAAQIAQQEDETKAIHAQIETLVRPNVSDPNELNREKLKGLQAQMAQLDRQFEEQQQQFVAPEKMLAMLENVIAKNRKLQLISLRNLPGSNASSIAGAAIGPRTIFRHTVELSVRGSYFDLLDYLATMERMPQRVFWDDFELTTEQYPQSVLKLKMHTLSRENSWLTV
ncbi:MAG: hypothetical protein IH604_01600 [Burkholderiales bacterium]|nr:hypothetical protein [Burkholderiales bacterium]